MMIDSEELMGVILANQYELCDFHNTRDYGMFTIGIQQAIDELVTNRHQFEKRTKPNVGGCGSMEEWWKRLGFELVTRCGECKWYDKDSKKCTKFNAFARPEDYCSYAERNEDE